MNKLKHILILTAGIAGLAACKPEIKTPAVSRGSADFTRYIAVGNSLTSGYADGGLYLEGQLNSFPSIIAQQMQQVGGGAFVQPLFTEGQSNGSGYLKLTGFNSSGLPILDTVKDKLAIRGIVSVPTNATTAIKVTTYTKYTGDINNYGVPGIKLTTAFLAGYGNLNGYYERMLPGEAPSASNSTAYIDFVTAKPFTFFSNFLGNNDALSYATNGGVGDVLTDKNTFATLYNQAIAKLTATGAKGVVATIPDVTAIPYFNAVTPAALLAGVQKSAPTVTSLFVNAKSSADATSTTYAVRELTNSDYMVLTFPTAKLGTLVSTPYGNLPYGLTKYTPIDNQYVLDQNEVAMTQDYVNAYNTTIKTVAASKSLAVCDIYSFFNSIKKNGLTEDGIFLNAGYITGGLFSLDGVHLTPRGYAVVANEFIKAINTQYGSTIPKVSVSQYRAVKFP
ncbi:G-D-S-L family lipolytic protein [Mucilaginibacter robiniae]|uniref:G-D-S-L family lipolytic protein n=1 Tax=Mucilaginibacter robiniae TaxID=2728022 RepID=A0A7L5E134_9SPHI|nr:SGNH/GDSL hydrolase family protein [Mucilaginibacter robiniae]QJD96915.1 G-D-S-L family lipolytic protein [Mucilaginibacter robiniae]